MNLTAEDLSRALGRIKAIALRQEVFKRSALRTECCPNRPIAAIQHPAWSATVCSPAPVLGPSVPFLARHTRSEIRQVKPPARNCHRNFVRCIQTEKPHAWFSIGYHVGSDVQFGKSGKPRNGWRPAQANSGHSKWHNSQPGLPFVGIDLQVRGDMSSQCRLFHAPVREEQIVPTLRHHPIAFRQWPGPGVRSGPGSQSSE
jgi:hypothetical protein